MVSLRVCAMAVVCCGAATSATAAPGRAGVPRACGGPAVVIQTTTLPSHIQFRPILPGALRIEATGGTGALTFTLTAGFVAAGLTLGSDGSLFGTPFFDGTVMFTVEVRDSLGCVASRAFTHAIVPVPPTAFFAPQRLTFGALRPDSSSPLQHVTPPQTATVRFSGSTPVAWTLTTSDPFVHVSPSSGTGPAVVSVSIGSYTGPARSVHASVTLSYPGLAEAPSYQMPITLNVMESPTVPRPTFGQVDTPVQNAAGVQGAIGVTGWALDGIGISKVEVFRNCLAFDDPASCQMVLGENVVFLAEAAFLPGARQDVFTPFFQLPQAYRAGWGVLLLTPMLPDPGRSLLYGGNGPLTLHVIATNVAGVQTRLGRSSDPASADLTTPTTITMANDTIAKPFGLIDTPTLGQTIGGVVANSGWALTPDANTTGGEPSDVLVPTSGATMWVFVDDLPVAQVAYNQCRAVGFSPTTFCNDDVSNIFGNLTPQSVSHSRASNPTRFRNLDLGRGPIGGHALDTTTLSNGLHTIAWSVTDSLGRVEGIGSRFFTVVNSGVDQFGGDGDVRRAWALAPPDGMYGRTGFDLRSPWTELHARDNGRHLVRLPEMGRMELWFGAAVDAGFLVTPDGSWRELPVGARVDGARFGWGVPVGFHGIYPLVFVRGSERIDVDVTIAPIARVDDGAPEIRMHFDSVRSAGCAVRSAKTRCAVHLQGWAYDPRAAIEAGIGTVHVWARRVQGAGSMVQGSGLFFVGEATLDVPRPDVAQAHGDAPGRAGFSLSTTLAPGTYEFTAYVWNVRTTRWEDARTVVGTVR